MAGKVKNEMPFEQREREAFMRLALEEGRRGLGRTSPNPPVGAVIVDEGGEVIGKGFHERAGEAHAEVNAIRDARNRLGRESLKGASLFVTLEPCSTHGRTPPCCEAILEAGIGRVFVGTPDPNPAHAGAAVPLLEGAGVSVCVGVCEKEAVQLIRFFTKLVLTGRPYLIAKTAMTLDGRTTLPPGHGQWISSPESREDVQLLRRRCDAILVGGETVRCDDPMLTLRGEHAVGRSQPERIVVTDRELPGEAKIFNDEHADRTRVYQGLPLGEVLDDLGGRGIASVLLESGGRLFSAALGLALIDEVVLYLAPVLGGGEKKLMPDSDVMARLEDLEVNRIGPDIRVTGRVVK